MKEAFDGGTAGVPETEVDEGGLGRCKGTT